MLAALVVYSTIVAAAGSSGDPLIDWISRAGTVGVLSALVVGFIKGWIVPGSALTEMREQRDRALNMVYEQAGLVGRAVDVSTRRLEVDEQVFELRRKGDDSPR